MQHEVAILLGYYGQASRPATEYHLDLIRRHNPGVPVVPMLYDGAPFLPGSVDLSEAPGYDELQSKWRGCDVMLYRWCKSRTFSARRYIYLEWDTRCTQNVADFYAPVWNADLAAVNVFSQQEQPTWFWFREVERLRESQPFAAGLWPFGGTLMSHAALEAVSNAPFHPGVFCELRLATAARRAGMTFAPMPFAAKSLSWEATLIELSDKPGIYHPVKSVV